MVQAACQTLGVQYAHAVTLYQSEFFRDRFPNENTVFPEIVYTKAKADVSGSLLVMREEMLGRDDLRAAVFIGGMEGVLIEYAMFNRLHPGATIVAVPRPGGASRKVAIQRGYDENTDPFPTDFTRLFIDELGVFPSDPRI